MTRKYSHKGVTCKPILITLGHVGPLGGPTYDLEVAQGTACLMAEDGAWLIFDIGYPANVLLRSLSDNSGFEIPSSFVGEITEFTEQQRTRFV